MALDVLPAVMGDFPDQLVRSRVFRNAKEDPSQPISAWIHTISRRAALVEAIEAH